MDLIINNTKTTTEAETPTTHQIQKPKPFSFSSNGVLKRKNHHLDPQQHHPVVVIYKECLKNHAANIGGHAVDGCGEFMPSPSANSTDPTSLKCAACGCHRNFHRRETDQDMALQKAAAIEYQPLHRHHPPPPPPPPPPLGTSSPNNSPSPPPISSAYYPSSAPHMLLALSTGYSGEKSQNPSPNSNGRKRFRTKFTPDQKVKMQEFAEQVGWKMQKRDEDLVSKFCNEIGVEKSVLKVWMHNNKNTFGKKSDQDEVHDILNNNGNTNTTVAADVNGFCIVNRSNTSDNYENKKDVDSHSQVHVVTTNGSSTSA